MRRVIIAALMLAFTVRAQDAAPWWDALVGSGERAWTPLDLGDALKLYLVDSALQSSGSITNWPDSSRNGLDATNVVESAQPAVVEIGGIKSAYFDGATDFLVVPPFSVSNAVAMFVVAKSDAWKKSGSYRKIMAKGQTDNPASGIAMFFAGEPYTRWQTDDLGYFGSGYGPTSYPQVTAANSLTNGQTCILCGIVSATQCGSFINGVKLPPRFSQTASVPLSTSGMRICVNAFDQNNQFWKANIFCMLFIQSDLSVSDRQKIEGWAAWRYGLVSELPLDHPYKGSRP